jgi:hypothetical protein
MGADCRADFYAAPGEEVAVVFGDVFARQAITLSMVLM